GLSPACGYAGGTPAGQAVGEESENNRWSATWTPASRGRIVWIVRSRAVSGSAAPNAAASPHAAADGVTEPPPSTCASTPRPRHTTANAAVRASRTGDVSGIAIPLSQGGVPLPAAGRDIESARPGRRAPRGAPGGVGNRHSG